MMVRVNDALGTGSSHGLTSSSFGAAGSTPAVVAQGVSKRFGETQVLIDVSVSIGTGVTGLLGSNGAGKTTLLSLVLGVDDRDSGDLLVLGHDPRSAGPDVRARIGYSPEHHHLPADVQAADLVRHLAQLHGLPQAASTERASDALWLVGLGEERFRPIGTMSTGQRQRVKLAAAIAHDPSLVLLDEPTDGLDPVQRDAMLSLIRRIGTDYGIDIVLSSHLLEEVERICDNVVIIADGMVRRSGSLAELRGARSGVIVEVDARADELAWRLERRGLAVSIEANRLVLQAPANVDDSWWVHDQVRDAVADLGSGLRHLADRSWSLEELFLDAPVRES